LQFKGNDEYFGLLIEPHFETFQQCVNNRADGLCRIYNAALVSFDFDSPEIQLGIHSQYSAMNSIVKPSSEKYVDTVNVEARTLQSILDENDISIVDNFYLDVEGYEKNVLNGIDFNKTKFNNIEVECHYPFLNITQEEELSRVVQKTDILLNLKKLFIILQQTLLIEWKIRGEILLIVKKQIKKILYIKQMLVYFLQLFLQEIKRYPETIKKKLKVNSEIY
jgi:FkbM family methyltransferase